MRALDRVKKFRAWQWLVAVLVAVGGLLYWAHSNPLFSDEEMIARFYAHRSEIESLVKSYREYVSPGVHTWWGDQPVVKALQAKAGVKRLNGIGPIWFPNPYSMEAAKQFDLLVKNNLKENGMSFFNQYDTIEVELLYEQNPNRHFGAVLLSTGPQMITKTLIYTPEMPRIENGILLHPASTTSPTTPAWPTPDRILPSLNDYPPDWNKRGECVFRQLEPQWFIRMCIAAI